MKAFIQKILYRYLRKNMVERLRSQEGMTWTTINKVLDAFDQQHIALATTVKRGNEKYTKIVFAPPERRFSKRVR